MDAIHSALILGWIEHSHVPFPHLHVWKPSVFDALSKDLAGVWLPLNSDNWFMPKDEIGKDSPSGSGK